MNKRKAKKIHKAVVNGQRRWTMDQLIRASAALAGRYNYTARKCQLLLGNEQQTATIVMDPSNSSTVFLRQDGQLQINGVYRV